MGKPIRDVRMSFQTMKVLESFLENPSDALSGADVQKRSGLASGTLYPILMRLADRKLLQTSWETAETGKPPRHMYRLTSEGRQ